MRLTIVCGLLAWVSPLAAQIAVFSQTGFPTRDSQPVEPATLRAALGDSQVRFVNLEELKVPETLRGAQLLVLPYGSSVPVDAWAICWSAASTCAMRSTAPGPALPFIMRQGYWGMCFLTI